jgi:hypothetical protein
VRVRTQASGRGGDSPNPGTKEVPGNPDGKTAEIEDIAKGGGAGDW